MNRAGLAAALVGVASALLIGSLLARESGRERGLTVFAAASLGDVAGTLRDAWQRERPDLPLTLSVGGSDTLAAQIVEGAAADVFLSADRQHPSDVLAAGIGRGPVVPFARTGLAIVVADEADIEGPRALARPGVRIAAAGEAVPISRYADRLLRRLSATTTDPDAFMAAVGANIITREDNVRAALAKVELGEADAAVVYEADVRASTAVRRLDLPEGVSAPATYAALTISDRAAADEFVRWLAGPEAQAILGSEGFMGVSP